MGEIADMMLDGTMCQECGVWMNDGADGDGYPVTCSDCRGYNRRADTEKKGQVKVACPTCGKKVKAVGLTNHQKDAHGVTSAQQSGAQS